MSGATAEVQESKIERRIASSERPTAERAADRRNRRPVEIRQPEDHKQSQAEIAAQRREALDDEGRLTAEFEDPRTGDVFEVTYDPDQFDFEFQLFIEQGQPAMALRKVIGTEQMQKFLRFPVLELDAVIKRLAREAGLGN